MPSFSIWFSYVVFCLSFLGILSACSSSRPPTSNNTLRIAIQNYPPTIDSRKSGDFISSTLICLLFEGLTRCLPDGSVEPALAKKTELSEDLCTYTFHLRKSTWSDGTALTSCDFEKAWKQVLDPTFPAPCAYLLYPIKNAEKAHRKEVSLEEIGVESIDEQTLRVTLERPCPSFYSSTAFPTFLPIPHHQLEALSNWDKTLSLVCNGPFTLKLAQPHHSLFLEKNPLFWNAPYPLLEKIFISVLAEEKTALQMFLAHELDWIGGALSPLPPNALEGLVPKDLIRFSPMGASTFCCFNTNLSLLKNKNLRKALSLAIDRNKIVENITLKEEIPATCCIPPALRGNRNRILHQPYDPELAKLYLEKALEELHLTREDIHLTLSLRAIHSERQLAQALQKQWKDVLGIEVDCRQIQAQAFKEALVHHHFDIALFFWISQSSDPLNLFERFQEPNNFKNYGNWDCKEFQEVVHKAIRETEPLERAALIERAEEIFLYEMPFALIYHWSSPTACHPHVQNLSITPTGGVLFERSFLASPKVNTQ